MPSYQWYQFFAMGSWVLFVTAFGCCVGSLINVLVYRLPRGLSVVAPPSRCPSCETRLTWRENIPVFGWLLLRGRCRFCKSKISPEYPIVEAFVGLLFALFFVLWYWLPPEAIAIHPHDTLLSFRPEWAQNPVTITWPYFVVVLMLLGSLVAMTLVDAKISQIPLELPFFATIVGLIAHPAHAAWVQFASRTGGVAETAPGFTWVIPTPGPDAWWWVGAPIGAMIGLACSIILLRTGLIRRSFTDYEEWERKARESMGDGAPEANTPELWVQYPHARREMLKEIAFLGPVILLGWLGATLAVSLGGSGLSATEVPLWLRAISGSILGYLVGGGIVWGLRIFGSLAFGKEAMGLGDAHLLAAVGACIGWIDSLFAFFAAAFLGIGWELSRRLFSERFRRMLPYGPFLAGGAVLVLLCKPLIELGMTLLLRVPAHQPPINIP